MSGDVQPRKRKDKKRKKDELSIEEPRGTSAALGDGDVFMHSYHEHGTGGHWCAKIIFFSLLAVLVTLIGLIILENRGLSELEANAVESRYSGVLDGWLEDAPDDDHHDEHTLELTHHDDDEDDHDVYHHDEDDDVSHEDDEMDEDEDDDHNDDGDDHDGDDTVDEQDNSQADDEDDDNSQAADEDEDDRDRYRKYYRDDGDDDEDDDDEEDEEGNERVKHSLFDQDDDDDEDDEDNDDTVTPDLIDQDDDDPTDGYNDGDKYVHDDVIKGSRYDQGDDDEDDDNNDDEDNANDDDEKVKNQDDDDESNLSESDNDNGNYNHQSDEDEKDYLSNEQGDQEHNENDDDNAIEKFDDNDDLKADSDEDDDDEHGEDDDDDEHDEEIEVEKIEQEPDDQEPISLNLPALPETDDDDDDGDDDQDDDNDDDSLQDDDKSAENDDDDFLDPDDDLPVVERITAPAGKPFVEVEDTDVSTELPPDTLEEEEEYEKKQEELRKAEEEESTNMWLKLSIGGALLAATHVVMRRATTPRDDAEEEDIDREETPVTDRRMTLIPEETVIPKKVQEISKPVVENVVQKFASEVKSASKPTIEEDDEIEEIEEIEVEEDNEEMTIDKDKELFSDDEAEEEEEEEQVVIQKVKPKTVIKEPSPEPEEEADDVEIIDEEQLEEEEISDVDDSELLTRLEAKYGRLPEPERPTPKHKDGGNNVDDLWPGEPAHAYWQQQLDEAERELRQGSWSAAAARAQKEALRDSARARYVVASAYDRGAEERRDNALLSRAIAAYLNVLKMHESLSDKKLKQIANRTLDRMLFRGNYLNAEPVYKLMIRRFPQDPSYRNNLSIAFLMANKNDMAADVLKETLKLWPNDRVALAHYAFVLKNQNNRLEEAVELFQKALKGDKGPACEPRFYYHLGDALLLLGRYAEAHEVHKRAAKLGHFLSPAQRSLYNVNRLKGQPWWNVEQTPYARIARALEKSWKDILKEGLAAHALYEQEREGLKERGEWSQLDLFARGYEIPDRCKKAPITCSIVKTEPAAVGCRRGQIKFSAMEAGTHVRPHVGPTNCRLRMHLALSNTKDTYLRVDQETRQWQEGKVLMFDDSFEHEVWHNGTGKRLVLIVDVWHPELTPAERRQLSPI